MGINCSRSSSAPGVHFFETEMDNLRSVSQASSSSSRKRVSVEPDEPAPPTWSPGNPPADAPASSGVNQRVTPLVEGAPEPACPPPGNVPRLPSKVARRGYESMSACAGFPFHRGVESVGSPSVVSQAQSAPTDRSEQNRIREQNISGLRSIMTNWNQFVPGSEPMPEPHGVPVRHASLAIPGVPTSHGASVVFGGMPTTASDHATNMQPPRNSRNPMSGQFVSMVGA